MQLLLQREPRTLFLVQDEWVLLFRGPPPQLHLASTDGPVAEASVVVQLVHVEDVDLSQTVVVYTRTAGTLGLLKMGEDTFLSVVTSSTPVGPSSRTFTSGPGTEPVSRILNVDFISITTPTYDADGTVGPASSSDWDDVRPGELDHPCAGVRKILTSGTFYFSAGERSFDLTTRLEARLARERASAKGKGRRVAEEGGDGDEGGLEVDERFLWNRYLVAPLLNFRSSLPGGMREVFDGAGFAILAIQGYVGSSEINLGGQPATLSLISRLGWKRAGTRYNVRGIDDEGAVANFVETETILRLPSTCFSYTQLRGSVPLFWEEGGQQPFNVKVTITRPIEASLPAFTKHFDDLLEEYSSIHIINLLAQKDLEAGLTLAYEAHLAAATQVDDSIRASVGMTEFDFHARSRIGGIESVRSQLGQVVGGVQEGFGACMVQVDEEGKGSVIVGQQGAFRTNCRDCLDRTNVVEDVLSRFALEEFLRNSAGPSWSGYDLSLWAAHRVLFAENGDALSKSYVGTGALNTSFTRSGKKSFAGLLSDAAKSAGRMYVANFVDAGKQKAIDALLGHLATSQKIRVFDPVQDEVRLRLRRRKGEYESWGTETVWVGTWNLNGKGPGQESLLPWMFPAGGVEPSVMVVAFQEIVPLNAGQIMNTDPEKRRRWEAFILRTVAERPGKTEDYVLLRSQQLVGTAVIVLVKKSIANEVSNVEAATKKTGVKGLAGNKGAVAIRLDFRDTSFCFLTAHLAAGHSNVEERNQDYFTIAQGLHFAKGRTLASHDNVVWAADTNYRIALPNEEARRLALEDDYASLYEADQLAHAMRTRGVFAGYAEAPILFRPTYKYDNGTDTFDSSEKQRVPAWTDRILYAGKDLDLSRYQRAELYTSDHRPVYALLKARVKAVDHAKRAAIRREITAAVVGKAGPGLLEDKMRGVGVGEVKGARLPKPSAEGEKWWEGWDEVDKEAAVGGEVRNPRVTNPFAEGYFLPTVPKGLPTLPARPSTLDPVQPAVRRPAPPPIPAKPMAVATPAAGSTSPPPFPAAYSPTRRRSPLPSPSLGQGPLQQPLVPIPISPTAHPLAQPRRKPPPPVPRHRSSSGASGVSGVSSLNASVGVGGAAGTGAGSVAGLVGQDKREVMARVVAGGGGAGAKGKPAPPPVPKRTTTSVSATLLDEDLGEGEAGRGGGGWQVIEAN